MSRAVLRVAAIVLVCGCGETSVTQPDNSPPIAPQPPAGPLVLSGSMTPDYQAIRINRDGKPVIDATLTVNGYPIQHCCADLYTGYLPAAATSGSMLNVRVASGGATFEAAGEVIPTPFITAPAEGTTVAATAPVNLMWSSPMDPDRFEVCLNCWVNSLYGAVYSTRGSVRQFNISAGALVDPGGGTIVAVYAFRDNFLDVINSSRISSNVVFVAKSPDAHINIQY